MKGSPVGSVHNFLLSVVMLAQMCMICSKTKCSLRVVCLDHSLVSSFLYSMVPSS